MTSPSKDRVVAGQPQSPGAAEPVGSANATNTQDNSLPLRPESHSLNASNIDSDQVKTTDTSPTQPEVVTDLSTVPTIEGPQPEAVVDTPAERAVTQAEMHSPKKPAGLKRKSISRASSADNDRSSPAGSISAASGGKLAVAAPSKRPAKKGTAVRKPPAKKRKSIANKEGNGGNTPVSSRGSKTPVALGGKPRDSRSAAGSPQASQMDVNMSDAEDVEDPNELFCICRKPDNHTWMIACDGGCEDWFHGRCVGIAEADGDLIDAYICPSCEAKGRGLTTWKAMCRLQGCRKSARINLKNPTKSSKYCSDEHAEEFFKRKINPENQATGVKNKKSNTATSKNNKTDLASGSLNGPLKSGELKSIVDSVTSVEEYKNLGNLELNLVFSSAVSEFLDKVFDPVQSESITPAEIMEKLSSVQIKHKQKLVSLLQSALATGHQLKDLKIRHQFAYAVGDRSRVLAELLRLRDPKLKAICGYDARLSWSLAEFKEYSMSDEGKEVLWGGKPLNRSHSEAEDENMEIETEKAKADRDEQTLKIQRETRGVCTRKANTCQQHRAWDTIQFSQLAAEERGLKQTLENVKKTTHSYLQQIILEHQNEVGEEKAKAEAVAEDTPMALETAIDSDMIEKEPVGGTD